MDAALHIGEPWMWAAFVGCTFAVRFSPGLRAYLKDESTSRY